jgi:hypothetical protein
MSAMTNAPEGKSESDVRSSPAGGSLVSVIVPVYNASATVDRALASVVGQAYSPLEIIVVDDGSSDDTVARVRQWMPKCDLHLIVQPKNGGPAAARNAGLAAARGEYVAFLDSDDEWLPEKTARQVRALEANPAASFCACDEYWIYPDGTIETTRDALEPRNWGAQAWKSLLAKSCIHTSSVVVRQKYVPTVGGFDETLIVGEDQDYWIWLARLGDLIWVKDPLVRVHKRAEGHMAVHFGREIDCLLPMIQRHIAGCRTDLSAQERRAILGRRYAQIGRNMCNHGNWSAGARLVVKAAALGYLPVQNSIFLLRGLLNGLPLKGHISMTEGVDQ